MNNSDSLGIEKPWCVYGGIGVNPDIARVVREGEGVAFLKHYDGCREDCWENEYVLRFRSFLGAAGRFYRDYGDKVDALAHLSKMKFRLDRGDAKSVDSFVLSVRNSWGRN